MSNVVPFTPGAPVGDWTSGERARLMELAERLMARGARVEVAYGVSDAGDPWCVIQDDRDEVLIHIARIDGEFVIHDAAQDAVRRTDTLWSALKRLLGVAEATVVDLRKAQALLALVMATLFVEEALREHRLPLDHMAEPPQPDQDLSTPAHQGQLPHVSATGETPDAHGPPPAHPAAAAPQAPVGDGELVAHLRSAGALTGVAAASAAPSPAVASSAAPIIVAESHAPPAGPDFQAAPTASAPDHATARIQVAEGGVARGTAGQDLFVLDARPAANPNYSLATATEPPTASGVILDFGAGDRLILPSGVAASIVSVTAVANLMTETTRLTTLTKTVSGPGVRVGVDMNGDGVEDAFVLVSGPGASSLTPDHAPHSIPHDEGAEAPIGLVAPAPDLPLFG